MYEHQTTLYLGWKDPVIKNKIPVPGFKIQQNAF